MEKLSAIIITFNEEKNIERCIQSLHNVADEIIVVDSFSTDDTKQICLRYSPYVCFVEHKWEGFSNQKNIANNFASFDYILSIDADEVLSQELCDSIIEAKKLGLKGAYKMHRLSNFCGHWVHHSGWYPDTKIRIWNRNVGKWYGDVQEKIIFNESVNTTLLKGNLLHYTCYSPEEYLKKITNYSIIKANNLLDKRKKVTFYNLYIAPLVQFLYIYFIRLGFLDGYAGFMISKISAQSVFVKFKKLRELSRNLNR